jgi:hypothetical protein
LPASFSRISPHHRAGRLPARLLESAVETALPNKNQ